MWVLERRRRDHSLDDGPRHVCERCLNRVDARRARERWRRLVALVTKVVVVKRVVVLVECRTEALAIELAVSALLRIFDQEIERAKASISSSTSIDETCGRRSLM